MIGKTTRTTATDPSTARRRNTGLAATDLPRPSTAHLQSRRVARARRRTSVARRRRSTTRPRPSILARATSASTTVVAAEARPRRRNVNVVASFERVNYRKRNVMSVSLFLSVLIEIDVSPFKCQILYSSSYLSSF